MQTFRGGQAGSARRREGSWGRGRHTAGGQTHINKEKQLPTSAVEEALGPWSPVSKWNNLDHLLPVIRELNPHDLKSYP